MDDFNNPYYRLGAAHARLDYNYAASEAMAEYASTADNKEERNYYKRKALTWKMKGIVEHDRMLNGIGLKV
jgi:hypothetical protein